MRLRVLLALYLLLALAVLAGFIGAAARIFWVQYGSYLPSSFFIAGAEVPILDIATAAGGLLLVLTAVMFVFLYLTLDRIFIRPIKAITASMAAFTHSQTFTPLPRMSLTAREIQDLTRAFVDFTNTVEQVHDRDMEMSRIKTDFISTAAHQLRTPLTGIRWALEALAKDPLSDSQKLLVDDAANKSRDLVAIVGTLLDISSIESGKHVYKFEPVQLESIAAQVAHDFAPQAQERGVTLQFEPPQTPLPPARADRQQVKWVLNNLIENGIRYTPAGGIVRVQMGQIPGRIQVFVRDTGIGISDKDRNNIFERFYRAGNAVAKESTGNGLGLYIARTIATDHGGDLNFAPNGNGPGTTFTFSIPTV